MPVRIVYLNVQIDATHGGNQELGFYDGTTATTLDLYPGTDGGSPDFFNSSHPHYFTQLGETIIFQATTAATGRELWITDGTAGGTHLLKDINSGPSPANAFLDVGNFGSQAQIDFAKPLVINGTMYFSANDGPTGFELWKTDGTAGNTVQVKNIAAGSQASNPQSLVNFNDTLYFVADDGANGPQVWKSDGTDANTVRVTNLAHPAGSGITSLVVSGGLLYFIYSDGTAGLNSQQIYVTDGTVGGEHLLSPSHPATLDPRSLTDFNGTLYFTMNDNVHGYEMWKTNGTDAGTSFVKDINDDGTSGSAAPSGQPVGYFAFNSELYFVAVDQTHGFELWKTNGTAGGTTLVKDINTEPVGAGTDHGVTSVQFVIYKNELYFMASDGIQAGKHNYELWKTNGSSGGTVLVADLFPGTGPGSPVEFQVIDDILYFGANAVGGGFGQIWKYDGVNPPTIAASDYQYGGGFEPFSFILAAPNTAPTQAANTGATVNEGQSGTIGNAQLDFDDTQQTDAQITYTVTALTANGTLFRNGIALAVSGTFTQADVVGNLITYTHNGSETTSDQFGFSVSDGIAPAITGQTFAITVTPQNDVPVITSNGGGATANVNVPENSTAVTTVTATDPDGPSLGFAIIGGSDAGKFEINASTGALKFINAPNFEFPGDSDANNSYVVQVRASDSVANDTQTITVNVTDVALELANKNDFNADGKADILWQNRDGTPAVWLVNGTGVAAMGPPLPNPNAGYGTAGTDTPYPWRVIDSGDLNGDGKSDILWQNGDGTPAAWLMDGVNVLATGPALKNPGPTWQAIASGDFNGDSKSDILWQNADGTPAVWLMNGVDVLSTGPALSNPGASWHAKDAADFNGDGKADILWQNADGTPAVWLMNGVDVLSTGPALSNPGASWHVKEAADANGDGKADIFWQHDNGTPGIWLMNGVDVAVAGGALSNPGSAWHIV